MDKITGKKMTIQQINIRNHRANTPTIQLWSTKHIHIFIQLISISGNRDLWGHGCCCECAFVTRYTHNWPESPALPGSLVEAKSNQRFLVPAWKRSTHAPNQKPGYATDTGSDLLWRQISGLMTQFEWSDGFPLEETKSVGFTSRVRFWVSDRNQRK